MAHNYKMNVTIESAEDKTQVFQEVLALLESKGIVAKDERSDGGEIDCITFSVTPKEGQERDIPDALNDFSAGCKDTIIRLDYEERESGAYGYGVLQGGKVLDSFMAEGQERASPLAEKIKTSVLSEHRSFEEAFRLHEPQLSPRSSDSLYLMLDWNSCQRVVDIKVKELLTAPHEGEKPQTAAEAYGANFRHLAPHFVNLRSSESLQELDEEIALLLLIQKYKPREIASAIKTCSPKAQVYVKPINLNDYAKTVLQAAREEQKAMGSAR